MNKNIYLATDCNSAMKMVLFTSRVRPPNGSRNAVTMKQTLGGQVGEVREHECNMHVCVGVG